MLVTKAAPLWKNTLGTFMSSISKELKLSQKYTNHCIRATAVSLLDECNFEARHIMRVSGHKSESSIRSYSYLGVFRRFIIIIIISPHRTIGRIRP